MACRCSDDPLLLIRQSFQQFSSVAAFIGSCGEFRCRKVGNTGLRKNFDHVGDRFVVTDQRKFARAGNTLALEHRAIRRQLTVHAELFVDQLPHPIDIVGDANR